MSAAVSKGAFALCIVAVLALAGCRVAETGNTSDNESAPAAPGTQVKNATGGAMQDRSSSSPEEALYVAKCSMCHRQMGMGTVILARRMDPKIAMLEDRTDLTQETVIQVARNGIGNMPRIQRGEVSDEQLRTIAHYLAKGKQ